MDVNNQNVKMYSCTKKQHEEFIKINNLTEHKYYMHSYCADEHGKVRAKRIHGFAFDEFSIDDPNFETQNIVGGIICR